MSTIPPPPPDVVDSGEPAGPTPTPARRGGGLKRGLVAGGTVVVLGAAGWGAWAAYSFFQTGDQPAQALPASTLGYVSVDLDPSGTQKIAALRTLNKFPAFKDSVGISSTDDLREKLFDSLKSDSGGSCADLDYGKDVEPWLGNRAAVAAVDTGAKTPQTVAVLQVTDADKAEAGLRKLQTCAGGEDGDMGGWHIDGDWAVIAETDAIADKVADETAKGSLADDDDYTRWTGETGDPGVISMYAAPAAGDYLAEHAQDLFALGSGLSGSLSSSCASPYAEDPSASPGATDFPTDLPSDFPTDLPSDFPTDLPSDFSSDSSSGSSAYSSELSLSCDDTDSSQTQTDGASAEMVSRLRDFKGLAATVRFSDGSLELSVAGDASSAQGDLLADDGAQSVQSLPSDVGAALGLGLKSGWVDALIGQVADATGQSPEELTSMVSSQTGLDLPGDAETLAGDSIAVAVGPDVDTDALESGDTSSLPVAVKLHGDADDITAVIEKLGATATEDGVPADVLQPSVEGDTVVLGPDADFRDEVAKQGKLGDDATFSDVVPDADGAAAILYVDLDRYEDALGDLLGPDSAVLDNLTPLRALGVSARTDGDVSHLEVRVSTN